ncbi:facilitated trehalose transporter Tret1-like [Penaeus monodon]|uniref:facilitated trehalose transporter Tret1-like n=1 Tax=Penaeus monodon TaxID=6687 RepID=UPI0018A74E18|nr:facilitated trehalose transporter Tret1-like [Penaeus monodon]
MESKMASEKARSDRWGSILRQIAFGLLVGASKFDVGMVIGWSAILPKMQVGNSTAFAIGETDVTWLVASPSVAGLVVTLFTGPLMEVIGPARLLFVLYLPIALLWLLQAFTPYLSVLYLARYLASGIYMVLGPLPATLISELSQPRLRGFLLGFEEVLVALGQMAVYVMADLLPWALATALCSAPFFVLFACAYFLPESPYWLVRKGREEDAAKALRRLRGRGASVEEELSQIVSGIKERQQATIKDQLRQFAHAYHYRPVILLASVFTLRELGGQYVLFAYTVYLFRQAGVHLDAFLCTILVGVMRVVFTSLGCGVVDRVGRRPLIITTALVCGVAEAVGALFLLVDVPGASWVPLAAVLLFVASYGVGLGPIPWALLGELLPTPVRFIGSSICIFSFSLTQFVVSYLFPLLMDQAGVGGALLVFAVAHGALGLVLWAFLPETRGQTLSDLQDCFTPGRKATEQVQLQNYKKAVDS